MSTTTLHGFMIHTTAPIAPLTMMLGDEAVVFAGRTTTGAEADCMAGWFEAQKGPLCRTHNVISGIDDDAQVGLALALIQLGYEVVMTAKDGVGNDIPRDDLPQHYRDDHTH